MTNSWYWIFIYSNSSFAGARPGTSEDETTSWTGSSYVSKITNGATFSYTKTCRYAYPTKQAAIRSELASRFSTPTGAPTAAEASKALRATAFNENFMVKLEEVK